MRDLDFDAVEAGVDEVARAHRKAVDHGADVVVIDGLGA